MAKNDTSNNKYAFIDYYLLDNLDKNIKIKNAKRNFSMKRISFYIQKITKAFFVIKMFIKENYLRIIMTL